MTDLHLSHLLLYDPKPFVHTGDTFLSFLFASYRHDSPIAKNKSNNNNFHILNLNLWHIMQMI